MAIHCLQHHFTALVLESQIWRSQTNTEEIKTNKLLFKLYEIFPTGNIYLFLSGFSRSAKPEAGA